MKKTQLNRRTFLRASGACIALPFMEAMMPRRALGSIATPSTPPLRTAIFTVSGGTVIESLKPQSKGPLGELPSILRPFEALKSDMTVVSGLSHLGKTQGSFNGHTGASVMHLTAAPLAINENGKFRAGTSFDQEIAKNVGRGTYLASMEMGYGGGENTYSFSSDGQAVPYERDPNRVFDRMFRGRSPELPKWASGQGRTPVAAASSASPTASSNPDGRPLGASILDLVLEEAKDLRKRLGYEDTYRLDSYLDSVRAVEKRIANLAVRQESTVAEMGPAVAVSNSHGGLVSPRVGAGLWGDLRPIGQDPEMHMEYLRTMFDLALLAFQTDTTRMLTFAIGQEGFFFPGVVTVGYELHYHTLQHQGNAARVEDADPISREACRQINGWYAKFIAEAIHKFKATQEAGMSLLDNSQILWTSYMADGGHSKRDFPAVLFGKAKGTIRGGQHIECERNTPMANLFVEMMNRAGIETDTFGDNRADYGKHNGRIPGLS